MKVEDLYAVVSQFEHIQIFNAKSGEPRTCVDCLADICTELWNFADETVYGLSAGIDSEGKTYIRIMTEENV